MDRAGLVCIVDDDRSLLITLDSLFRSMGLGTRLFQTPDQFLSTQLPDGPCCLVLDIRLPGGVNGLEVQDLLAKMNFPIPVILMTGYGDIPMTVQGMKAGAVDFLAKPFRDQDMLDAVGHALERDRLRRSADSQLTSLRSAYATLTQRERDVMAFVVEGHQNRHIAGELGIAEITVKMHRSAAMKKMRAKTLAELVRMNDAMNPRRSDLSALAP